MHWLYFIYFFQAFTVVTVFNAMTFALKVTPFSVKSLSEASVAIDRFKVSFLSFFLQIFTSTFVKSGSVYFACCSHRDPIPVNPGIGASVIIEVCLIWSRWMILGNWLNKMGIELFLVPYCKSSSCHPVYFYPSPNPADYFFVSDFSGRLNILPLIYLSHKALLHDLHHTSMKLRTKSVGDTIIKGAILGRC